MDYFYFLLSLFLFQPLVFAAVVVGGGGGRDAALDAHVRDVLNDHVPNVGHPVQIDLNLVLGHLHFPKNLFAIHLLSCSAETRYNIDTHRTTTLVNKVVFVVTFPLILPLNDLQLFTFLGTFVSQNLC